MRNRREAIVSVGGRLAIYYDYTITNRTRRLYLGVTNDLGRRVYQHQHPVVPGFTSKHFLERLVYFQDPDDIGAAIARDKELKVGAAERKSP